MSRDRISIQEDAESFICSNCRRTVVPSNGGTERQHHLPPDLDGIDPSGVTVGRVIRQTRHLYRVVCGKGPGGDDSAVTMTARVSGAFEYRAVGPADFPTLGDFVLVSSGSTDNNGVIHSVLPRRTALRRAAAGEASVEQVFVANIDVIFLVFGLDGGRNFTTGLLERSLVAASGSGARPVVVLNKVDCADADTVGKILDEAGQAAPDVSIHTVSALRGDGMEALRAEAGPGMTVGLLGKSGVGKSALVNALAGNETARTGNQRAGDRSGRHTTTHKELYLIPDGPVIADLPGLRELQIWADSEDLDGAFPEIDHLAESCRFRDCSHTGEPDCAVLEALRNENLPRHRYDAYMEYRQELAYLHCRRDQRAQQEEQKKWKRIAMEQRRYKKR